MRCFKTNFFWIAGTSEAETSESGKAECLLAICEDKKVSFLQSSPSPLTTVLYMSSKIIYFCDIIKRIDVENQADFVHKSNCTI